MTLLIGTIITFSVDAGNPPTCEITSPNDGDSFCNEQICVSVQATDPDGQGIQQVTFESNGYTGFDIAAPFEYCFQSQNWPDGQYTITVTAEDDEGLISSPESIVINIDCKECETLSVGICDDFNTNLPYGGEQTNPRQELLDFIADTYPYSGSRDCDEFGSDRHWAHTFDISSACPDCCIDEATLEITVCNKGDNDRLNLGLIICGITTVAIELDDTKLAMHYGENLNEVQICCGSDDHGFIAAGYELYYTIGSLPADISSLQPLASGTSSSSGWDTVIIPSQQLPDSGSAFVIIKWAIPAAGYDTDNTDDRGGWMLEEGSTGNWVLIDDSLGIDAVWGIEAGVGPGSATTAWLTYADHHTENHLRRYSWAWSSPLSSLINYGDCDKITIDLTTKPNVMNFMNKNCFLDVDVQDDSAVDCANLTICCCPCCLELIPNDDGDVLWEEYVQPGPSWLNPNRERKICWKVKNTGDSRCECIWKVTYPDNHVTNIGTGANVGNFLILPNNQMQFCAPSIEVEAFNVDYLIWNFLPISWDCPTARLEIDCSNTNCPNPIIEELTLHCSAYQLICPYDLFGL